MMYAQIHAAFPRLVLHVHDDDAGVRQACRVFSLWTLSDSFLHQLFQILKKIIESINTVSFAFDA